jgi:hypothetical protein
MSRTFGEKKAKELSRLKRRLKKWEKKARYFNRFEETELYTKKEVAQIKAAIKDLW